MDNSFRLYDVYSILTDPVDKITDHESEYMEIINAAKGSVTEKGLACQFIPQFLKHFPNLFETALETQLDLVEDDDTTVRKMSINHLPKFCKVSKNFVPKIADVLTQMLLTDDSSEFSTVQAALVSVMEIDVKGTLQGILTQISNTEEDAVRKRAIEFLSIKLKALPEDIFTKEVEQFFLDSCKNVFSKVSGQDFLNLLPLVCNLRIAKTMPVQNAIVDIIALQLDLDSEFNISENSISGFINFMKQACPLFSPYVSSHKFVSYILVKIFPLLEDIKNLDNGINLILDVFKMLAEISPYVRKEECTNDFSEVLFKELLNYIPLPPKSSSESDSVFDPNLYFTHIECLLYIFTQFLKHNNDIITATDNLSRFTDLKSRLLFLSGVVSRALKRLKGSQKILVVNEESKMKALAEQTMINLNALIKDFYRIPLSFKCNITLSWKYMARASSGCNVKRPNEASSSSAKRERKSRELYVPPSGKYSSRLSFSKDSSATGRSGRY